jgi:hypothetical protein
MATVSAKSDRWTPVDGHPSVDTRSVDTRSVDTRSVDTRLVDTRSVENPSNWQTYREGHGRSPSPWRTTSWLRDQERKPARAGVHQPGGCQRRRVAGRLRGVRTHELLGHRAAAALDPLRGLDGFGLEFAGRALDPLLVRRWGHDGRGTMEGRSLGRPREMGGG